MTDFETCPVGTMAEVERLRARVAELEGRKHFASALADQASAAIETTIAIAAERDSLRARVAELERTGSAVVARWDSPDWKDGTHTKDYIDALRAALSKDAAP
jgi:BMFP domain-containing protein YqiC